MRINRLSLAWFRGAGETAELAPEGKSMIIYGNNGSGKSSFVDGMEYVLRNGKIDHLAHEYSGKRQERAIVNTHKPTNERSQIEIELVDFSKTLIRIHNDGRFEKTHSSENAPMSWESSRVILRQDDVAQFIYLTKGQKYSAILPLIGLEELQLVSNNLRIVSKNIEKQTKLDQKLAELRQIRI